MGVEGLGRSEVVERALQWVRNQGEDPYHVHDYRVNFDGSGLVALTQSNGTHRAKFSPDRRYLVKLTEETIENAQYEGHCTVGKNGRKRWSLHIVWDDDLHLLRRRRPA